MSAEANAANLNRLPGHSLKNWDLHGAAHAICSCGEISDTILLSDDDRLLWQQAHKDVIRQQIRETMIEAPKPFPYMTTILTRTPRQKPHESLGQAKKAVLYRLDRIDETLTTHCEVYQWTDKGWETLWKIKAGTKRQDLPWVKENRS